MLIEIHIIQNHSPANLNRDDLGAPKTCFFGGVLRSRISSRVSSEVSEILGIQMTFITVSLVFLPMQWPAILAQEPSYFPGWFRNS